MLTIRDHDVQDYAALRDMDATDDGVLGEDDRNCLDELGQHLVSIDAWRRFSIWLLHKHFEPVPREVLVERSTASPPRTQTAPMPRADFPPAALKPTAIRFDRTVGSGLGLVAMEFAGPAELGGVAPIDDADEAVLKGLAERLQALGKAERFRVRLIRNNLSLSDEQMLSETCDLSNRTLHCKVVDRDASTARNTIETSWHWKPADNHVATDPVYVCEARTDCAVSPPDGTPGRHIRKDVHDKVLAPTPPPPLDRGAHR